jgi:hypothetical protein
MGARPELTTVRTTPAAPASRWSTSGWTRTGGSGGERSDTREARLARSRDIIAAATARHLAGNETLFLHPPASDGECDEARASLPR